MSQSIVESQESVTILGPSEAKPEDIEEVLRLAPSLVAADGGAKRAIELGHIPDAVIGDFDSIPHDIAKSIPNDRLHRIAEQDSTDFEKCLTRIAAPLCLAVGFLGRRVDHELAVLNTLVRHGDRRCLLIGARDLIFAAGQSLDLNLPLGSRLSLFPMAAVTGKSEGLRWPITGIDFSPDGRIGTSNEVTGPLHLEFDRPGMLVILPRVALAALMPALQTAPRDVPAR